MARNNAVQQEIATLEARLSASRALLHEAAGEAYVASEQGTLDLDRRMRLRLATTLAMKEATDVSVACYRAAGTVAIRVGAPFERRLRDALTASQHVQGALAARRDGGTPHHRHRQRRRVALNSWDRGPPGPLMLMDRAASER